MSTVRARLQRRLGCIRELEVPVMPLFGRKKADEEPVDPEARSPELGVKYKDLLLMGQLIQQGADLHQPRHALYYLYFGSREAAESGAADGGAAGYTCEVRDPMPQSPTSGRSSASGPTHCSTRPA